MSCCVLLIFSCTLLHTLLLSASFAVALPGQQMLCLQSNDELGILLLLQGKVCVLPRPRLQMLWMW